jgi:uncharacterized membrane protein
MTPPNLDQPVAPLSRQRPFRRTVLQGLGVVLPPLLTVVIFIWAWNTIRLYVLDPLTVAARDSLVWYVSDVRTDLPGDPAMIDGREFIRLPDDRFVPADVVDVVRAGSDKALVPATARQVYQRYVELQYLQPHTVVPVFLCAFILLMYLLGKFLAIGIGRFVFGRLERAIQRLPLVRSVYSSVKQVTDFMLSEQEFKVTRIVAVEYPRKGAWAIGFVTGEGLSDVRAATGEPVLSVLIPTSPMPMTGFTAVVARSETIDLNITLDQALQFIVSCGVVCPPQRTQPPGRAGDHHSALELQPRGVGKPAARSGP